MRRSIRIVVTAAVLFAAAAGIAYATNAVTAASTSELHACANATNGNLRLVEDGAACRTSEQPVSWNVTGPAGPAGTNGTNGSDGVSPTVAQLAAGDEHCADGGVAITDAAGSVGYVCNGAKGESGDPFSGHFTSPNGLFSIDVGDGGIVLQGPSGKVTVGPATVSVRADTALELKAGAALDVDAGTLLTLNGAVARLTGSNVVVGSTACSPALRRSDQLVVTSGQPGTVAPVVPLTSSLTVCIG